MVFEVTKINVIMKTNFSIQKTWKLIRPHVWAVFSFLVLSMIYFAPVLIGKEMRQGDVEKFQGMSKELQTYYEQEGKSSLWTGSMFSGMPAYTIGVWGGAVNPLDVIEKPFKVLGSKNIGVVFVSMLTCYLLFLLLGANILIAILGAIAFSFSSYSIIILEAGHITKAWAMAYMPLVLSGFFLILKHKYWWGGCIFAFALALQIKSNHIQITYYLALFCVIIYLGYLYRAIQEKHYKAAYLTFITLFLSISLSALCNLSSLYTNYESAKESIRGKSELTQVVDGKTDKSDGLDKDYAFAWSYGIGETFTLLIPDFYGGASGGILSQQSNLAKALKNQGYKVPSPLQTYTYWGEQPFTSGPVYFGAIICFLFVLSFWIVRNPLKWWILVAVVFFMVLSWGRHWDVVNTFFFHYLPFYNKFRTVSMALVIPQLAFALMSVCALIEIFQYKLTWKELRKPLRYALCITGGLCLLFGLLLPFDFNSSTDQYLQLPEWYLNALRTDRGYLLRMDALRSLLLILAAGICIYWGVLKRSRYALWVLGILILVDLWGVDKRYLNEKDFITKQTFRQVYQPALANKIIWQDKDLSYRVLSLNNPFNDSYISYFHKSIGGYSAAKLRRYQELIDLKIQPELQLITNAFQNGKIESIQQVFTKTPVLDMLNMRYLIFDVNQMPIRNSYAYGNAWFVNEVQLVDNADAEMTAMGHNDLHKVALIDKQFEMHPKVGNWELDTCAKVVMTEYKPDYLSYEYESEKNGVIVFSEVYYPHGWQAFLDGSPIPHFRTNWILRGLEVPAGKHVIEFRFSPTNYFVTRNISIASSSLLLLLIVGMIVYKIIGKDSWKSSRADE